MKVVTYKSFGPIEFGMSENEVLCILGSPIKIRTNSENELEYHYDAFIVRYDSDSKLVREGTLFPKDSGLFQVNDLVLDWGEDLFSKLCAADGAPFELYGYVVLVNLGISLTEFHDGDDAQKAITVFREGDWNQFMGDMRSFKA